MTRRRPPLDDRQLDLLAERLATIRVGRRELLALAVALTGAGPLVRPAEGATAPRLAPGERLAREQVFRYGGGGWWSSDPTSHDFNKDMFCNGVPALFAGLLKFNADHQPVADLATKVTPRHDGAQWVFTLRRDSRWSDGTPCTARDFEWSWKRQLDPATVSPYATFFYDLKNGEAFNKKRAAAADVGVRARDAWTLEVTLEGPRAYFPILAAFLAALPAHRRAVERHGDRWTEASTIVCNGPFVLERWEHNRVMVLGPNPHFYGSRSVTLQKVVIPIIPTAAGALPYENNEIDMTSLQPSDLKRLQANARTAGEVFRYPFPGTWYLIPQVTRPPFDNIRVRRAVAHAVDRDNLVKVAQGFAMPAHAMIPPGFPGATADPRIKALQRFDPKLALAQLEGTPWEGGRNWPRITLTMQDEARGSRPLAQAVQAVLLEHLNMHTELSILDPRVFRERLWKHEFQLVWIRWFMDYPDPHNEYFDTFYGKRTTGKRQAWSNDEFDRELELGRDTRDPDKRLQHYLKAEEILQREVAYVPVAWVVRYAALKPWIRGLQKTRQGQYAVEGNIYVDMLPHLYVVERA